jgi:hypothetical protein
MEASSEDETLVMTSPWKTELRRSCRIVQRPSCFARNAMRHRPLFDFRQDRGRRRMRGRMRYSRVRTFLGGGGDLGRDSLAAKDKRAKLLPIVACQHPLPFFPNNTHFLSVSCRRTPCSLAFTLPATHTSPSHTKPLCPRLRRAKSCSRLPHAASATVMSVLSALHHLRPR